MIIEAGGSGRESGTTGRIPPGNVGDVRRDHEESQVLGLEVPERASRVQSGTKIPCNRKVGDDV